MHIEEIKNIDEQVAAAFKKLIPQLVDRNDYPTAEELQQVVSSDNIHLLVAKDGNKIVGSITVALYHIPTGKKAIIEDVVVDKNTRGKGIASQLMKRAIEVARKGGARKIELTSNPTRIAANKMYVKFGFKVRHTNFYRLDL